MKFIQTESMSNSADLLTALMTIDVNQPHLDKIQP